jgi:hypothetical protein
MTLKLRYLVLSAALLCLLAACGAPAATIPTTGPAEAPTTAPTEAATAVPTEAPTATPTEAATVAPTTEATEAPTTAPTAETAAGALPNALYLLRNGQIFRLEADGVTQTQITYEVPFSPEAIAVVDFAVSPVDNTLVYSVQREGPSVLVRSGPNGEDPARIFESETVGVNDPLFTPDGRSIAARLQGPFEEPGSFQSGLYLIPLDGGEPQLLVPDDPIEDPNTISEASGASAQLFSPDGSLLLINRFGLQLETCNLAVVTVPEGVVTPIEAPDAPPMERQSTCSSSPSWAPDGSSVYFTIVRIGAPGGEPAIWRADPATGVSELLTEEQQAAPFTLYFNPSAMPDGQLLALSTEVETLPEPFASEVPDLGYSVVRVDSATGESTELRPAETLNPSLLAWDDAGSGVAVMSFDPVSGRSRLIWLPAGEGETLELIDDASDTSLFIWAAS